MYCSDVFTKNVQLIMISVVFTEIANADYYSLKLSSNNDHTACSNMIYVCCDLNGRLGYERVYLPLYEVADTPFHSQIFYCLCM